MSVVEVLISAAALTLALRLSPPPSWRGLLLGLGLAGVLAAALLLATPPWPWRPAPASPTALLSAQPLRLLAFALAAPALAAWLRRAR